MARYDGLDSEEEEEEEGWEEGRGFFFPRLGAELLLRLPAEGRERRGTPWLSKDLRRRGCCCCCCCEEEEELWELEDADADAEEDIIVSMSMSEVAVPGELEDLFPIGWDRDGTGAGAGTAGRREGGRGGKEI